MFALQRTYQALKAHTGINHVHRQRLQRAISLAVILHEDNVPNLNHLGIILVDQLTAGHLRLLLRCTRVQVDLRTGTARTGIAHLPEVIVLIAIDDMIGRHMLQPVASRLIVTLQVLLCRTLKHGHIEIGRIQVQHIHQVLPSHVDGALLEVIAKAPVSQHLEHRVVVRIMTYLLQIVMLSAHAQALLRIRTAAGLRLVCTKDDVFPLVHTCIRKHQCRISFHHHRCGRDDRMPLLGEEVLKRFTDFFCCQHNVFL